MLLAAAAGVTTPWVVWLVSLLLVFGGVEILYTAVMGSVFKRPPALLSDLRLTAAGLSISQGHAYWIVSLAAALLIALGLVSHEVTAFLFRSMPAPGLPPLLLALLLVPPCLYHWRRYGYAEFPARTVYSPALHLWRNIAYGRRLKPVLSKDEVHFASHNHYRDVVLCGAPTVVMICVESYGSLVYRYPAYTERIRDLIDRRQWMVRCAEVARSLAGLRRARCDDPA
jgi:hypothetical protein